MFRPECRVASDIFVQTCTFKVFSNKWSIKALGLVNLVHSLDVIVSGQNSYRWICPSQHSKMGLCGRTVDIPPPEDSSNQQHDTVKKSLTSTRSSTETFLVGYLCSTISGLQLPTNRQAFLYFLYIRTLPENSGKPAIQQLAYDSKETILPFWQMACNKTACVKAKCNATFHETSWPA